MADGVSRARRTMRSRLGKQIIEKLRQTAGESYGDALERERCALIGEQIDWHSSSIESICGHLHTREMCT